MIDLIKENISGVVSAEEKLNKAREFLQVLMLKIIFDKGYSENIAFTGGTALRILYGVRRYSEDMDFSLVKKMGYDFNEIQKSIASELKKYNFFVEEKKSRTVGAVHGCFIKFPDLIEKLNIRGYAKKNLLVKIEVDSNPPKGGNTAVVPLTDRFVMVVNTFDLQSLFATKLHACFFRKYTKGRDFYDLVWYLGKKVLPNFRLLNNAIIQTEKKNMNVNEQNYKEFIAEKVKKTDFRKVRNDVERFLEDKAELKLLDKDLILAMLKGGG